MSTLFVENVPTDLYEALRECARTNRRSMAAEVIALLEENIPTRDELKRRTTLLRQVKQFRTRKPLKSGRFPSAEEMVREDRAR
jgi:plasmid stability protein